MLAGQRSVPLILAGWVMAAHSWLYSARTRVVSCWVLLSEPSRVGSTRCSTRCTETDVAWLTSEQPAAAATASAEAAPAEDAGEAELAAAAEAEPDDVAPAEDAADDEPEPAAGAEATTEPHPASAEHSSTASTVPRTWRGDIMRI